MKKLLLAVTMALSLVSCSTDELSNGGGNNASSKGVELVLSTDGFEQVGTRAISESVIQDVNILEYKGGSCVKAIYLPSSTNDFSKAIKVTGLSDIAATTMQDATDADGNAIQVMKEDGKENFIFVVANYGSAINADDVTHLSDLQALKLDFTTNKDVTKLPMTGFYYGGINTTATTQMNVNLQRAVAKINYTVNTSNFMVNGKTPSQIIVNSIKLCNVPSKITLYPCQNRPSLPKNGEAGKWSGDPNPFPSESEMASSVTYGDDDNQSTAANTFVAYIPENARGSYSNITTNKDKRPSNCGASENNDKCFTYALVDLNYMTADGTEKKATYKIYLGGDANGDMNLLRNTQYNVTTYINGADANSTDTRITVNNVFTPGTVSGAQEAANCYIINASNTRSIIIPLSQARKGWSWIANKTKSVSDAAELTALDNALNSGNYTITQVWSSSSTAVTGAKVSSNSKFATITIPSGVTNGNNAVIALKISGKTYWSWHLWFTDYVPATGSMQFAGAAFQSGGRYASKKIMDRNLGATITGISKIEAQPTTAEAPKYYGMFYQYGRKDPFLPADGTSVGNGKAQIRVNGDQTTCQIAVTTLANAVQNPTVFYAGGAEWTTDVPAYTDFWSANSVKSAFDPCPPGWRVPTGGDNAYYNPWAGFANGDFTAVSNSLDDTKTPFGWLPMSGNTKQNAVNSGRLYNYGGVKSWYPASGNRESGSDAVYHVGGNGFCWSATSGRYLNFSSGYVNPASSSNRSCGFPVRCVQE